MEIGINHLHLSVVVLILQTNRFTQAHYRCEWVSTENVSPKFDPQEAESLSKARQCYHKDSDIMSSFVEQCTGQKRFIRTCSNNGQWDCSSFIGFCKTLIKVEIPREQSQSVAYKDNSAVLTPNPNCPPGRSNFSLQEMSLAVLVSFISGSIVLTAIVVIIWKCRHAKWESDQTKSERRQKEQRTAALHAITQIARVLGPTTSGDADTVFYLNPAYSRTVASDIIDMISENDHIYEEVMLRRMSSCLSRNTVNTGSLAPATVPTPTPGNSRKKISKSNSLSSIVEMAEHLELDDNNELDDNKTDNEDDTFGTSLKNKDGIIEIEAPSTSDSGYMEEVDINKCDRSSLQGPP